MRKILSLLVCSLIYMISFGQSKVVTGTVTDERGNPVGFATVKVKGSITAVAADENGRFTISAPADGILEFSSQGLYTQEISVNNKSEIFPQLKSQASLDEVVVTALGVGREKRSLGYSVQSVNPDQLRSSQEPNLVNALAGKVAGVQINNSGGQAGSSSRIVIRGNTSLTGNNQPLFVIDGIPVDNSSDRGISENTESALFSGFGGNRAIDIDPNTIESTTVLKGAAATALYGSRGAFGVIVITTKKGKSSADRKYPRVSLSSSVGFDKAFTEGFQHTYLQGLNGLYRNGLPVDEGGYAESGAATQTSGSWGPNKDSVSQAVLTAIGKPTVIDPRKEFYRTGKVYNNSISVSGGGDKTTYVLTYSNLSQEGIVRNNDFKRNSISASVTSQLSRNFNSTTKISYINSENSRFAEGNGARSFIYGLNFQPISFDAKEAYDQRGNSAWTASNNFTGGFNNPFWLVNTNSSPSMVDRIITSNESSLQILPWMKLTNRIGLDTYTDEQKEHVDINTISVPDGRMYDALIKRKQINNDLILSMNGKINDNWTISGLVGHNVNSRSFTRRTVRGTDLSIPGFFDITNAEKQEALQSDSKRRLVGVYASATVEYKDFLYLNATARNDWSSTLPQGSNSFFYPSVSAGFIFTNVLGLANNSTFPYGKIRVSYAQAGNDADEYLTQQTYTQANPNDGTRGNIAFPFNGVNGFRVGGLLSNDRLSPEIVTEKEIGADLRFLNNRLGLDVSLYDKVSKKQILQQEIAGSSGYTDRVTNAGELSNRGIEVVLTATPVKTKAFFWDMQFNFAKNTYKLKSIAEGVDNIFLGGFTDPQIRADKNFGYGVIWGLGFARNDAGAILVDDDGLPLSADALGPIGNATPKWNAGLRNTLNFMGIGISFLFDMRKGGDIINFDSYYSVFYGTAKVTEQRNKPILWDGVRESDGKTNTTPVLQDQNYFRNWYSGEISELFVEDASFLKLREITLSYNLPQSLLSKTPFEGISLSVTGRNLWIKSDFTYKDPEGNLLGNTNAQGFYHGVTPGTRGVTAGIQVRF